MNSIATWEEAIDLPGRYETIATEPQQDVEAGWDRCIDALSKELVSPVSDGLVACPSPSAILAALEWIHHLRAENPSLPPILIVREPSGGIIIERRWESGNSEITSELTIYNDLTAEHTIYENGRISQMEPIKARPWTTRNGNGTAADISSTTSAPNYDFYQQAA
ncbi:MAG TPA: hypothetical protein VHY91_09535 [Pirellulales bacterium]|jgi:hypothetical protein|nr:hypothetical protein [Pirellulales bacterium]